MARYLTPAKIGLLALIELYSIQEVPVKATIPVLSFLTSHLLDSELARLPSAEISRWDKAERTVGLAAGIDGFEKLLRSPSIVPDTPDKDLWNKFLVKLWSINTLDALHQFFTRLSRLLAKTNDELRRQTELGGADVEDGMRLSRNSPFGVFVRRSQVEFSRLRFHDATELWTAFTRYRQPTVTHLRPSHASYDRLCFDHVLVTGEQEEWNEDGVETLASIMYGDVLTGGYEGCVPISTDDIEILLEFQIEQMQKFGNRIPVGLRSLFEGLLRDSCVIPSLTHYLSFLDSWRAGDYQTAFDALHRYFDYTMHNRDRLFYQYALMNLAVLQADFGCYQDSIAAMLETVSTARENRDMICLNFALNWLFHFGRAHPAVVKTLESDSVLGTGKETLAFLRVKAKETGMWTLWSSALLSEAKLGLANGESVATSLEFMTRSSQIIILHNMKNMFGSQLMMTAALWDRLGVSSLSVMASEIFLRCHSRHGIFDDDLKTTCRLALTLAFRGAYEDGLEVLRRIDENALRSWKSRQFWVKYKGIICLKRDLHRNNLDGADEYLSQLLQSKQDDLEPDMAYAIDFFYVDYLTRRGDFRRAFQMVEKLLCAIQDEKRDISLRVRLLLLKASLYDKCGRPQRGFTIAMRAASISWKARLMPCLWHAIGTISNILTSLGEFDAAIQLLVAILPRALECETSSLTAQLYSNLADANMGLAGTVAPRSNQRGEYMTRAAGAINRAFSYYSSIEDVERQCELLAKKATIMKLSGDRQAADKCVAEYLAKRRDELEQRRDGGVDDGRMA